MNMFCVTGTLEETPEIMDIIGEKENRKELTIKLAVKRSLKDSRGLFEINVLEIKISREFAENVCKYCQKGDVIGVNGFIGSGGTLYADRVTFISGKKD